MNRLFTFIAISISIVLISGCAPKKKSVKKIKKEVKDLNKTSLPKKPSVKVLPALEVGPNFVVPTANCSCK